MREIIVAASRERKVKSDVDLMRRIGDLYRGDWADAPSFSRDDVDSLGMYSALARGIGDIKASAAPAAGWKELVRAWSAKGQAKQDEVEWSGLNDWLDTRQGRVTRTRCWSTCAVTGCRCRRWCWAIQTASRRTCRSVWTTEYRIANLTDEESRSGQRLISAENRASDDWGDTNQTKYGSYTLPGGENYREVLLALPERSDRVMFYQVVGAYPKDGFGSRDEAQAYIDGLTGGQRSQRQTRRRKRSASCFGAI